jgi:4-carboxymuconolactone decarboxylase
LTSLNDRYLAGRDMRGQMSGGDTTHYALPGVDQLAPDLKRIIDEALFGTIWRRPGLDLKQRCIATISALMTQGELNLLRRHIVRALNVGLTPNQVVEIFIQSTFYIGVPHVESALRLTKDIYEELGIHFQPALEYDTNRHPDEQLALGQELHRRHMGNLPDASYDPDSPEGQLERIVDEYNWGAIYNRSLLDDKERAIISLAALTSKGVYDNQMRRRIRGAIGVGLTPTELMEVFIHLSMYGGYINTRTAMRIARSVFNELEIE